MKKTFSIPTLKVAHIAGSDLICTSPNLNSGSSDPTKTNLSRRGGFGDSFWDEDE